MNKKLVMIAIALVIFAIVVAPVAAAPQPAAPQNPNAGTSSIWVAINDLFAKVAALTLKVNSIPAGAQGPKGDTGATGATGATGPAGKDGAQGPAGTGATVHFGDKAIFDFTSQTAATDGFVYATAYAPKEVFLRGSVDNEIVCIDSQENANLMVGASCTFPVKAGQSWTWYVLCQGVTDLTKCDSHSSVSWMPLVT